MRSVLLAGILAFSPVVSIACECAGPATFCGSLNGPWSDPDIVVLGVKLDEVYYGMHVKVVQAFAGGVAAGDTIMVWGDNGGLCRWYVSMWNNGDTVLWAFHNTDFMGNIITAGFPPDLEQPGDYHISACGIFWLNYSNGIVSGPLAPDVPSMPLTDLQGLVDGCMSTGVNELADDDQLIVHAEEGGAVLELSRHVNARLLIVDALGRTTLSCDWQGQPLHVTGLAAGIGLISVTTAQRRWLQHLVVL